MGTPRKDSSDPATGGTDAEPRLPSAPGARAGRCAIVGRPNVGKSTLLNALLRQKLVIATPRPGTTRSSVLGVYASDDPPTQIAFVDTPGLHRPKSALGKVLLEQAQLGLADADVVLFMTDPPKRKDREAGHVGVRPDDESVLKLLADVKAPILLAVNKVDLIKDKTRLFPIIEAYQERHDFAATIPISAVKRTGLDGLIQEIREGCPEGRLYDDEFLTDRPARFFAAELVREAVMRHTRQEVPHGAACVIDEYENDGGLTRITASIIVEKKSHKGIVIGKAGARLKTIGTEARHEIERMIERKVFLKLWVKVVPGWTAKPTEARRLATEVESS